MIFHEGIDEEIKKGSKADNMNFWGELVYFSINVVFFFLAIFLFYKYYHSVQFKNFIRNNQENNEIEEKLLDNESPNSDNKEN